MPLDDDRHHELPRITAADLPNYGGIVCPDCGCTHFYTTHTERIMLGLIRRRKYCRHCGRRVVTFEQIQVNK